MRAAMPAAGHQAPPSYETGPGQHRYTNAAVMGIEYYIFWEEFRWSEEDEGGGGGGRSGREWEVLVNKSRTSSLIYIERNSPILTDVDAMGHVQGFTEFLNPGWGFEKLYNKVLQE
jgi:hypothetical protein